MSGHSKWHNIQQKKGKKDVQRANIFTKLARGITVATREGGTDPSTNFSLRLAIDKAKEANMPKDNIDRAIQKGSGELKDGEVLEEILYEGFGAHGVGILVDCVTDNKNRSASDMKHIFNKHGGSLGAPGSVSWQFERLGVVRVAYGDWDKDKFELQVIDAGADDLIESEEGIEVRCKIENFQKVLEAVQTIVEEPSESGLEWIAKEPTAVDEAIEATIETLYDALDELDDVRAVYTSM